MPVPVSRDGAPTAVRCSHEERRSAPNGQTSGLYRFPVNAASRLTSLLQAAVRFTFQFALLLLERRKRAAQAA